MRVPIVVFFVAQTLLSAPQLTLTVRNELPIARSSETVEVPAASLGEDPTRIHVFDGASEVLAQVVDGKLIFQTDMPANGTRTFTLRAGEKRVYKR